jgi:hypothetical protein
VPKGTEVDAGSTKTPAGDKVVPKKMKPSQKFNTTEEGECAKEICTGRKKGHFPSTKRTRNGGYNNTRNPLDNHPTGNNATQAANHTYRGSCKKAKAHKQFPEYTITEDDTDLMAEKVQEHAAEEFEDTQHQRG